MPLFLSLLWRESEKDPVLRQTALRGLRKYQEAKRPAPHAQYPVFAHAGQARLLHPVAAKSGAASDSAPEGKAAARTPVVLVPSLVNSHEILDLSEQASLARYLARAGHDPWLVDWGMPAAQDSQLDLAGHVEQRLLPLLAAIGRPVILVGYCLGGTLALAAAQRMPTAALAVIAAPWRFDQYPEADRTVLAKLWQDARPLCERFGYVPMEVLQSGFWSLDPERTVRKYAAFAEMEPGSTEEQAFLTVEDWANEGAPLTFAAARDLFESFYGANDPGAGRWMIGGEAAAPAALRCPTLSIRSTTDRIVPAAVTPDLGETLESRLGHVGMIVSHKAPAQIWQPLSQWLSKQGG